MFTDFPEVGLVHGFTSFLGPIIASPIPTRTSTPAKH
jgi:hypothetical protein